MAKENILVVEDEEDIAGLVEYNLVKNDYHVTCAGTGEDALSQARATIPDLVILDLMLPGMDGLEVCRALKQDELTHPIPIIMLTAKGEEADVVRGLESGADDYVTKPFSVNILLARVKAVLRRRWEDANQPLGLLKINDLEINPGRHEVKEKDQLVDLTLTEFRILYFLARRPGWVFTRNQIIDAVHGDDYPVTERSVDVQIVGLRKKLGDSGKYIETVRGVGYRYKG